MKMILRTIVLSVFITASSLAYAGKNAKKTISPELEVQIKALDDSKVIVKFDKLEGELVRVKIYDTKGEVIYTDKETTGTDYAKRFDLSAYPAGMYSYSVSNDLYTVKKTMELK